MDGTHELLQAQAHVWKHIFNFLNSMSLKCVVELGVPDIINRHGQPMTTSELAAVLHLSPSKSCCLHRLMRLLARSGFFTCEDVVQGQQTYSLTSASKILIKDDPFSVAPFLLGMLDPLLTASSHGLSEWFKRADHITPFHTTNGCSFWDYADKDRRMNAFFNEAMASDTRLLSSVVLGRCKGVFEGLSSLVDVGGGNGTFSRAISEAFRTINCTVLDLPHVVSGLEDRKNMKYVSGDMFEAVPPADAILLKSILHDWNDEECVKILGHCKEAILIAGNTGKLIIIDIVLKSKRREEDEEMLTEAQLLFDMMMMVLLTGKERSEEEWARLFLTAGFSSYKMTSILGARSLIEVYP